MKNFIITTLLLCLFVFLATGSSIYADDDALAIIRKMDEKQASETSKSIMSMIVYTDADDEATAREMKMLLYSQGDDDTYMEFIEPRTITGLRILSKGDDQWVFFPSTGRTRKIASSAKKDSVKGVGGDFSYEDMSGGTFEGKYTPTILEANDTSWVIEGLSKKADAVYSKVIVTVDKQTYLPHKMEYYTDEEGHYKDMLMEDFKVISGRDTATKTTMITLEKNTKTVIILHEAEYDIPIPEKYFDSNRFSK
jgi:hypothetical protein